MAPHFSDVPPSALLIEQIRNIGQRLTLLSNSRTLKSGLSYSRARILSYLMWGGPKRATDLAQHFRQAPRTVTEAIDGLERDGFVIREDDTADRRVRRITVTDRGQEATFEAAAHAIAFGNEIGAVLGDEDLSKLRDLLSRIERYLDTVNEPLKED